MSTARKSSVAKKRFYANWDLSKALRNPHQHPSQYMTGNAGRLLTGAPKPRKWRIVISGGCTLPDGTVFDANDTPITPSEPCLLSELMPYVVEWLSDVQPGLMEGGGSLFCAGLKLKAECWI